MKTRNVIILSLLLGVLIGIGAAGSVLTVNAWNPVLEYKKHADLMREAAAKASNPNAKISIENKVFDFGVKDVKEKGSHDFPIKNVGTAPLTLEVNRTTCSCTGIDLSTKKLAPGETAIATVRYDAERATGSFNQGGSIVTNDPENREILLTITGVFTSPIVVSPSNVVFPNLAASETKSAKIRIYGFEKTPLSISESIWTDREHFDLKLSPSEMSKEDKENTMNKFAHSVWEGVLTIKPGLPIGSFQEKFVLKTNFDREPTVEFLVRGQVFGGGISLTGMGYNKDTGAAVLGKTVYGQKLSKEISIQLSGTITSRADLKIKEVKPSWLKATLIQTRDVGNESARRRFYSLTIEVPADAPVCNYFQSNEENVAMIILDTGLEETPTLKLPVQFAVEQ